MDPHNRLYHKSLNMRMQNKHLEVVIARLAASPCMGAVEDEKHMVCECPLYAPLRLKHS